MKNRKGFFHIYLDLSTREFKKATKETINREMFKVVQSRIVFVPPPLTDLAVSPRT
jgi:hypothetical protein